MAWHDVTETSAVAEGQVLGVTIGEEMIALYRIEGVFYATSNICTHAFALMSDGYLEDDCIECPVHQALFHVPTGEARSRIAKRPLKTYPVKVENDRLMVEITETAKV
ncbi:non-heme iron oxygenase ferredoxin subunit [Chachezhania sediminis]|uniref:non-heme iron oxygenase ferredoxin subunit n=1 Tax=Chachezhania sediminis TaxID=2599291 RepID=UPI00131CF41D|nr:non-heme iron oxygenase ferredoxin subunit [Chachezhania sediminis]